MFHSLSLVAAATDTTTASPGGSIIGGLIGYLLVGFALMGVFKKAGEPGWAGFVPFYNSYLVVKLAGYNGWLFLLYLIPIVGFVFSIFVALGLGRAFGKGGAFSFFLLWLLSLIGYFVVGYDSSRYIGAGGKAVATV